MSLAGQPDWKRQSCQTTYAVPAESISADGNASVRSPPATAWSVIVATSTVARHVVPPSPALAHRYGESARDRLYLLRPDGYIGFRCLASESSRLETHLAGMLTL